MQSAAPREINVLANHSVLNLSFDDDSLCVQPSPLDHAPEVGCCSAFFSRKPRITHTRVPIRQVIDAHCSERTLHLTYVDRNHPKTPMELRHLTSTVIEEEQSSLMSWSEALMELAYAGVHRNRYLRVIINPFGGPGKAKSIYTKKVEPILAAGGCSLDVTYTTHRYHAQELARDISLKYDAVIVVSGDGVVHEVINGLAQHNNPEKAFCIPVVPIPAGSANALSLNILGLKDGLDPCAAALNALKGKQMKLDLFSLNMHDEKRFAFLSHALGLMAELDRNTEPLRWMGDIRFMLGFLYEVARLKTCPIQLSIKVVDDDKQRMVDAANARNSLTQQWSPEPIDDKGVSADEGKWVDFQNPIIYMYAGKGPFMSRTLMQFPASMPDDGLIDIVLQEVIPRKSLIDAIDIAEEGGLFWTKETHYVKASAYRVKALEPSYFLMVDGEEVIFDEFTVEVHPRMATVLSPYGCYPREFKLPNPEDKSH
ncbi:hypothetical protein CONPUDRAFT_79840 [Coniophora puteana RWD-64-598 SS2]|uniref:DAGKc domain-containing protein n=1 Tax=Coniophora puteana (strain RWD-64-598) TaxID=741705 RepID=A0A5M3N180_CONPW|nr:uncharacterized protein CONPUDRAFT_79840 [Coniophora puteana RWD-64-598 SS2]EIW85152.1 hypothetical protein CONPUDRAFT_79840 [Coniophora puteana RWD-64-598 SS2]